MKRLGSAFVAAFLASFFCSASKASAPSPNSQGSALGVLRHGVGEFRSMATPLLFSGTQVSTQQGWVELLLGDNARIRVSAYSRVLTPSAARLEVGRGRVWVMVGDSALVVELGGSELRLEPGCQVVLETEDGGVVTVGKGEVFLQGLRAGALQVLLVARGEVRSTGAEVFELVRREADLALRDPSKWRAWVLEQMAVDGRRRPQPRRFDHSGRLNPLEDPVESTIEEARRSSPFD